MNPLQTLLELARQKDELEAAMRQAVAQARAEGVSWQAIANKTGGTKQAAQQKYSGIKAAEKLLADLKAKDHTENAPILAAYEAKREATKIDQLPAKPSIILDDDRAGQSVTPSIFLDPIAPAKTKPAKEWPAGKSPFVPKRRTHGALLADEPYEGAARPGTGKGPHLCVGCGDTNHHGQDRNKIEYNEGCSPTKYDTQEETDYLNGLTK